MSNPCFSFPKKPQRHRPIVQDQADSPVKKL